MRSYKGAKFMIKVLFVCHGNICRSTMSQCVLTHLVKKKGLEDCFEINSAATSREEIGNPPHYGTVSKLRQVGIPVVPHRAIQMTRADYDYYDYLIGMDSMNIKNMERITGHQRGGKIRKMLEYANSSADCQDPWYNSRFDQTYRDVVTGCTAFLDYLKKEGKI